MAKLDYVFACPICMNNPTIASDKFLLSRVMLTNEMNSLPVYYAQPCLCWLQGAKLKFNLFFNIRMRILLLYISFICRNRLSCYVSRRLSRVQVESIQTVILPT